LHKADLHFYAEGAAELDLPEGRYEATVSRGPETRVTRLSFEIRPGETTSRTAALSRWIDQRAAGWYSGESHIHANYGYGHWYNSPGSMLLQCAGEDLGVSNFMVANSDGDGVFDREYFRGRPDPLSNGRTVLYWNEEFRSTIWGHMTLLNLKHVVEPVSTGFLNTTRPDDAPTNADVADLTHDQGGHANYTHPAQNVADPYLGAYTAKALPMDVALGKIDSLDVMGSNHEATVPLWYRLLNCGFRLPASAGTDCFLNRITSKLPGSDRVYVQISGPFSYEEWARGLKAGRTFVTNGPMLEFSLDGKGPGDSIQVGAGGGVRVRGRVVSQFPLDRLDVIQDGRVVATSAAKGDRLAIEIEQVVSVNRSGWVALRASGPPHPDQPGGSAYAHTSAVAIEVPDRPADASADARYFVAWIDRLAAEIRRRDRVPSRLRPHVEAQLAAARAVYEKLSARP
ncbi:MAG: CehA/McbA family metallohydrolase, partial [Isosphaeraceae bacterium]